MNILKNRFIYWYIPCKKHFKYDKQVGLQ